MLFFSVSINGFTTVNVSCKSLCDPTKKGSAEYQKDNEQIIKEVCSAENKHNGAFFKVFLQSF